MADALVLGTRVQKTWRFESSPGHDYFPKTSLRARNAASYTRVDKKARLKTIYSMYPILR